VPSTAGGAIQHPHLPPTNESFGSNAIGKSISIGQEKGSTWTNQTQTGSSFTTCQLWPCQQASRSSTPTCKIERWRRRIYKLPCTPSPKGYASRKAKTAVEQLKVHWPRIRNKECKDNHESESEDDIWSEKQMRMGARERTKKKRHNRANSAPFRRVIQPTRSLQEEQSSVASVKSYTQSTSQLIHPKLSQWRSEPTFKFNCKWQPPKLKLPSEEEDRDVLLLTTCSSDSSTPKCSSVRNMWLESPSLSVTHLPTQWTPTKSKPNASPSIRLLPKKIANTSRRGNRSPASDYHGYRSSLNTESGETFWLDGGSQPVTPSSYAKKSSYARSRKNRRSLSMSKLKKPKSGHFPDDLSKRLRYSSGDRGELQCKYAHSTDGADILDRKFEKAQFEIDSKRRRRISGIKKYDISKKTLGKGSSAKVKKATNWATKEIVAVKIINDISRMRKNKRLFEGTETSSAWDNLKQEISIMKMLSSHPHRNIVQLYEVVETKDKIHIVMEYLEGGPVMAGKTDVEPFKDMERIRRYLRDLLMGLEYLHALRVVHMDIKPENLLLDKNDRLKIIDFGAAKHVKDGGMIRKFQGTPAFTPPETTTDGPFRPWPVDIWAVGVTLYTFGHGSLPFYKEGPYQLYQVIQKEEPKFNMNLDPDYISCIESCLIKNPDERTTLRGLRTHPWVTKHGKDPLQHQEFPEVKCVSDDCKIGRHERSRSSFGQKSRGRRIRKASSERDVLRGSSTSYESQYCLSL